MVYVPPFIISIDLGSNRRGTDRVRRSEAITHGTLFQKAVALVDLAEDGIGLPEQILDQSSFGESAKYYFIFTRLDVIWSLNYFALLFLNFFESFAATTVV